MSSGTQKSFGTQSTTPQQTLPQRRASQSSRSKLARSKARWSCWLWIGDAESAEPRGNGTLGTSDKSDERLSLGSWGAKCSVFGVPCIWILRRQAVQGYDVRRLKSSSTGSLRSTSLAGLLAHTSQAMAAAAVQSGDSSQLPERRCESRAPSTGKKVGSSCCGSLGGCFSTTRISLYPTLVPVDRRPDSLPRRVSGLRKGDLAAVQPVARGKVHPLPRASGARGCQGGLCSYSPYHKRSLRQRVVSAESARGGNQRVPSRSLKL